MQPLNSIDKENLLPVDGQAYYFPGLFGARLADDLLKELLVAIPWKQEPIRMFGKQVMQPRLTAYYGDADKPYTYSGITMVPAPWTNALRIIKEKVEMIAGVHFNAALLNQYRDGADSMGWHRDNERSLGQNPVIASVSLGAARKFSLRHYTNKKLVRTLELQHGSLLLMQGATQHHWEHQLPKTAVHKGLRVNITFRVVAP
ncbi:MAG: alpha-ketoglutarate-dependent dioxygenase AlkB [Bacteroidota bacterium]